MIDSVSEVEVSPSKHNPEVVERTFLIADVRGYTRFTRQRGDAEAARLAGAFAGLARDAVAARGGTVIELRGDEALAVFVSPAQAVRAAVELVAMCAEDVEANPDLPLLVGIGVDAGQAVPLEGGFRGAAINTAARLCSQAAAGQVLITAALAERTGQVPGVVFAAHAAVELKGFEAPVELIQASASPRPFSPPPKPVDQPPEPLPLELEPDTPMVGREHELSWLRGTWRQARRGNGRLVFVSGPEGIGRTRLAAELAAEAASQAAVVRYVGSGGAAQALAVSELRAAAAADRPTLLILDDVDVLGEQLAPTIESLYDSIEARPALVVCLVGNAAIPAVSALVEHADGSGDGHRLLAPLTADGVDRIAELYAGEGASDISVESLARASGGIPARVHELMSEWAEREAARRLAAAAEWLSAERLDRQADLEFANNVIGLKLARLYAADRSAGGALAGDCPYKGLASFDADDSRLFFGREQLVGELAARTVGVGLLAVIGASGSGKSSVIAAGLVPSLRAGLLPGSERWRIAAMRPGDHPATELAAALAGGAEDERLVLVIDQFEELFAAGVGEAERVACVEGIVAAATDPERFVVVIGLRADFYGHCGSYPELARLLATNQVLVGPMRERELRRAIELPARRVGVRVDSALVDRLVSEVVAEPGGLPLLSTALVELWGERTGSWLRLDAHARAGGVRDAVARLAETTYQRLSEPQRVIARSLFLRLVATGEEGMLVRRTMHRSELGMGPDEEVATVVARLTDDRLLTATDDTVEVAHEALLREWPRLADWLREDAQGRELREHLMLAAKRWDGSGRDTGELYRGARLASTIEWAATRSHELNDLERGFLAESRSDADREAERQRRANRRLRLLLAGLSVVLLCAVAAGVVAFEQRSSARHEATVALGRQLGAEAVSEPRIDRAMLLARESLILDRSSQTEGTLLATLLRSPAAIGTFTMPITDRPLTVSVSPDGHTIAVGTNDPAGVMRFYDTRTHRQTFTAPLGPFPNLYLPGTHDLIGTPTGPAPIELIDPGSGRVLRKFQLGHLWNSRLTSPLEPTAISPDERFLFLLWAVVRPDGSLGAAYIERWSIAHGGAPTVLAMGEQGMVAAVVTSDNRLIVATDGAITTWSAITLKRIGTIRGPRFPSFVNGAISPDGRIFGYGLGNGTVHFVNVATGRSVDAQGAHAADVQSVAFSPNSRVAVSTGDDGVAIVWDPRSGRQIERLAGHAGRIPAISFSPDGRTLYTASLDGTVLQWDIAGRRRFGEPFTVGSAALAGGSPDPALSQVPPAA
ncbi:MAG: hypothetical protein QOI17_1338, partial [Gaiellales bacterium]|nr:hypothetical protein [Gaiellales bacterium]